MQSSWLMTEKPLFAEKENTQKDNKGEDDIRKKRFGTTVCGSWNSGAVKKDTFPSMQLFYCDYLCSSTRSYFSAWLDKQQHSKWFTEW